MTPPDAARGTTTPTRLLARTFFGRFFESDLLPPDVPQAQFVVWSLAFLAMPGLLLPIKLIGSLLQTQGPEALARALLLHRLIFIALSMTVAGVVALIVWDGVFPDRRDARILTPLPVSGRVLIGARLLALAALCGIFIVGVNAVPTLTYGLAAGAFGGATNPLRGLVAHFVSTTMAAVFVFTALLALQGARAQRRRFAGGRPALVPGANPLRAGAAAGRLLHADGRRCAAERSAGGLGAGAALGVVPRPQRDDWRAPGGRCAGAGGNRARGNGGQHVSRGCTLRR